MIEHNITINFFGLSYRIHSVFNDGDVLHHLRQAALKMFCPLERAILDPEFFDYYGDEKISHISFLSHQYVFGLVNDESSFVEIKVNGLRKRKVFLKEIINQETLFPVYHVNTANPIYYGDFCLRVVKEEMGRCASFNFKINQPFSFEKLNFNFIKIEDKDTTISILESLSYSNAKLKSNKCETLVRSSYAVVY